MLFGSTLARLRRSRGWSQEMLALRAGLSQRHVSFLETGRARPGDKSLRKLVEAMALRGWEQRILVSALAPSTHQVPATEPDALLVEGLAERLSPWPTYAFRPDGSLVSANQAMERLLLHAAPEENLWQVTAPPEGPNIYDLALHPHGLVRWMINPEDVVPETIRRLRIEAASEPAIEAVVRRLERYPAAHATAGGVAMPPPVLIERYALGKQVLSVISVVSHLASPGEIELAALRIETFVPADEVSERIMKGL